MRVDKPAFAPYIRRLEQVVGFSIDTMEDLRRALLARIDYFEAHGCRVSDHALDGMFCVHAAESALNETLQKGKRGEAVSEEAYKAFHTDLLLTCARAYAQKAGSCSCTLAASGIILPKCSPVWALTPALTP